MVWWIGSILLSILGFWMVQRGWCGPRRVVSRTRRCPKCRYDMSAMSALMVCTECGFQAHDEVTWYAGRRRLGPVVIGVALWIVAMGVASWPSARVNGYLSFLPLRAQIEVWPAWLRTLRFFGLEGDAEWNAVQGIPYAVEHSRSQSLRSAVWEGGLSELRRLDPLSEDADEVAYIMMQTSLVEWPGETGLAIEASPENVFFLLRHPNECAVAAGMQLALYSTEDMEDIFSEIASIRGTSRAVEGDPVYTMIEIDRRNGYEWIESVLAGGSDPDLGAVAMWIASYATGAIYQSPQYPVTPTQKYDRDLEITLRWLRDGPVTTRTMLATQLLSRSGHFLTQWSEESDVEGFTLPLRKPEAYREILTLSQDMISSDKSTLIEGLSRWMQRDQFSQIRVVSSVLCRPISDSVAERIMAFLEINPKRSIEAIGDLDAFAADPSRNQTLRERAEALANEIRAANQ